MARKNEKVAALLSMYCESVPKNPRGPAPPLRANEEREHENFKKYASLRILHDPKIKPIVRPTPPPIRAPIL